MRSLALAALLCFAALRPAPAGDLTQVSTLGALMTGVYEGEVTLADLGSRGDLGLGTINGLDGELVLLDGTFYRVAVDGHATPLPPATRTPFAMVTRFTPEITAELPAGLDLPGLEAWITALLPPGNRPLAIRIDGRFTELKTRSVPGQTPPYVPLLTALKDQVVVGRPAFEGTVVGFRLPAYFGGINAPGFHFHALDRARAEGGHVLGARTEGGRVAVARIDRVEMLLPHDASFAAAPLGGGSEAGANAVEGQVPAK